MEPFYALIVPQAAPPGVPPGINYPTFPSNPIAEPPWGWGNRPPQVNYPTFPTNPIARPPGGWGNRPPLGIWGGGGVGDYIDAGFPGPQPGQPPQIWGGPYYPPQIWHPTFPTNPIVIPPEELPPQPLPPDKVIVVVFVPGYGYKMLVVDKPPGYNPPTGPSTERPTPVA